MDGPIVHKKLEAMQPLFRKLYSDKFASETVAGSFGEAWPVGDPIWGLPAGQASIRAGGCAPPGQEYQVFSIPRAQLERCYRRMALTRGRWFREDEHQEHKQVSLCFLWSCFKL